MSEAFADLELGGPPTDPFDASLALGGRGLLAEFNRAGLLHAADVHVARRVAGMAGERRDEVLLALALAVRAVRLGSVCLDVSIVRDSLASTDDLAGLSWPAPAAWLEALADSPAISTGDEPRARPGRLVGTLLYLDRYWRQEQRVAQVLDAADGTTTTIADPGRLAAAVARLLGGEREERQRLAARVAAGRQLTVVAGGPGTGKTTTVARLLAVLADQPGPRPLIALAAPTGKAAARLGEAVRSEVAGMELADQDNLRGLQALTLHRLLGWKPGHDGRFRHHAGHPLPFDIIVVDETSMVSLTMMAHLFDALRPQTRIILVGDPDQLASVEAGAVLADIVARAAPPPAAPADGPLEGATENPDDRLLVAGGVVRLTHRFRFGGAIAGLADAIVGADADATMAVLTGADPAVEFLQLPTVVDRSDVVDPAAALTLALRGGNLDEIRSAAVGSAAATLQAARAGDAAAAVAALGRHQLLCAHRHGPFGAGRWSELVETWAGQALPGYAEGGPWYLGRPVLMRVNDPGLGLYNGDAGVVITDRERGTVVAFGSPERPILVSPARLGQVETVHALTIHKSQGSQYDTVTLVLPPPQSPLLTRELLYTAVTRARSRVRVIGTEEAVRAAVARPVTRASGLRQR